MVNFELTENQINEIKNGGLSLISEIGEVFLTMKKEDKHPVHGDMTSEKASELLFQGVKRCEE